MADVTLTLRVRDYGQKAIAEARLRQLSWRQPLRQIALLLKAEALRSFDESRDPDGQPWAPLKRPSRKRGGPSAKPLRRTGILMGSQAAVARENDNTVFQGTNVPYAGFHQFGTSRIPARPFAGVGQSAAAKIGKIAAEFAALQTSLLFS